MYISLTPQTQILANCKYNYRGLLNIEEVQLATHHGRATSGYRSLTFIKWKTYLQTPYQLLPY